MSVKAIAFKIDLMIEPLRKLANRIGAPVFDLVARIYVASVFWKSGMLRWADFVNGTFDRQIFLFELEHPVPGLSPEVAAYGALAGEIILPILLFFGLFGRFAAAGILIMIAVIEFTYIHSIEHVLWAFLALSVFIKGPGMLSLDTLIRRAIRSENEKR